MFLVGIFQWWYGRGWVRHFKRSSVGILRTADYFSVGLLFKTLFNPFRQISAGKVQGGLPEQIGAFVDRTISRFIGANIRAWTIAIGLVVILLRSIWVLASLVSWSMLPFVPAIGLVLWLKGGVL